MKKVLVFIFLFILFDYAGTVEKHHADDSPAVKQHALLGRSFFYSGAGLEIEIPASNAGYYAAGFKKVLNLPGLPKIYPAALYAHHTWPQHGYTGFPSKEYLSHIYPSHNFW